MLMIFFFNQLSEIAIFFEYHHIISRSPRLRMMNKSSVASDAQLSSSHESASSESSLSESTSPESASQE